MTFVEGAVVTGWAAHVLNRLLARQALLAPLLKNSRLTAEQRAELESVIRDIRKAARRWEASAISDDSSYETPQTEIASLSPQENRVVTVEQASILLGLGVRRTQQLAAGGLGVKVRGRYLLDAAVIDEYRQGRRTGEGDRPDGRGPQAV